MGLLDEAIREHLDLKRRNGADPGDIARKENEALTPVVPVADRQPVDPALEAEADSAYAPGPPEEAFESEPNAPLAEPADFEHVAQETAELDMEAELDGEVQPHAAEPHPAAAARPVRANTAQEAQEEDSLEWEMPGRSDGELAPEEIPGQERLSFE
jgi:hypothetical protein